MQRAAKKMTTASSTSPRLGNAKRVPLRETRKRQPSFSLFDSKTLMELKAKQRDRSTSISLSHCDEPALSLDLSSASFRNPSIHPVAKPQRIYENTYKTEPDQRFEVETVRSIIQQTLSTLENLKYDSKRCAEHSKTLSNLIRNRVKQLKYARYKFVCSVTIGELREQGLHVVSRCVWDPEKDNFATATYENSTLLAVGTVHAIYMD